MDWLLLIVTGLLSVLVVLVVVMALRLRRLERRLSEDSSSDANWSPSGPEMSQSAHLDAPRQPESEYVITHLGDEPEPEPVPVVEARLFADIVLRETVVQAAGLVHGLRRALAPEVRNRIRFEIRREIKRSRKQRRIETREARREWEARERAVVLEDTAA